MIPKLENPEIQETVFVKTEPQKIMQYEQNGSQHKIGGEHMCSRRVDGLTEKI